MKYKLGKKPARPDAVNFKFNHFFNERALPEPPQRIGHELIGHDWHMLGNDKVGNCVFAGAAHEHMVWTHMGSHGAGVDFTDANVISDYAALTGYDGTERSDRGADMVRAASYRRRVGILDSNGQRHKIDAYVALRTGNIHDLAMATYLTGAVGIGINFPNSAGRQFDHQEPWGVVRNSKSAGGHYIPCIGRNSAGLFLVVTWGRIQAMTPQFYQEYSDEALGYLSIEILRDKLSPEGFAADDLLSALDRLAA